MRRRLIFVVALLAMLIPIAVIAQSDGGKRKKKQQTTQTQTQTQTSTQKKKTRTQSSRTNTAQRQAEEQHQREAEAQHKREEEARRQREAEAQGQRETEAQRQKEAEAQRKQEMEEVVRRRQKRTITNGHDYVDLGLPSGLKWATCNIGASSPGEYGDYFAWGETTTKSDYSSICSTYNKTVLELESEGIVDSKGNLTPSYDAAHANWGGSWRMPTRKEFEELKSKCVWKYLKRKGVNGLLITGPNGNSMFLPLSGHKLFTFINYRGEHGYYWSSEVSNMEHQASYFQLGDVFSWGSVNARYLGYTIRPVTE